MELTLTRDVRARSLTARSVRVEPPALAAWTLGFALVAYLAMRDGGYDTVVRSEAGVAIWWIVLLASLGGLLPAGVPRRGWIAIGLLVAFAAWTGLAMSWSESAERSAIELGRVATYAGVLVLAIAAQGRAAARHTIAGVACAIGLVTVLAVASRLQPQAFPANAHFQFLGPGAARKLSYPLNYWNALAAFAAMGAPLLLALAVGARTLAGQAVAAAVLPLSALCVSLTVSRGGALALGVALVVFLLLAPRRLEAVATLVPAGVGAALLVEAVAQRDALAGGLPTAAAAHQGSAVIALAVMVCGGVALMQVAIGLAARHAERPAALAPPRPVTARRALALLALVAVVAVAAGVPGRVAQSWADFKAPVGVVQPGSESSVFSRLQAANGNGRYEFWRSALAANRTRPWTGIGPGTFEFWWARNGTTDGFVRDAHTLYLETLAETGIVGLALLGALLLWAAIVAVRRSLTAPPDLRVWIAAAAAGLAAFLTSAALEWVWEMAAVAVAALVLVAVIVAGRDEPAGEPAPAVKRSPRAAVAVLAVLALAVVSVPMAGAIATRRSEAAAASGDLAGALRDTRTAARLEPYAATPELQQALVLELAGDLPRAASAARAATAGEPTNWRTWLVRARIDARRGATGDAVAELRRARELNPRSPLFTQA